VELPPESFDGAVCRWMLMYLPDPARVTANVANALRPGGICVAMEYVKFGATSLWPHGDSYGRLNVALEEIVARIGSGLDVGGRVPKLLVDAGLEIVDVLPFLRVGPPGSPIWKWMERANRTHADVAVDAELIPETDRKLLEREWKDHEGDPSAFVLSPPVLATIGRKPE
jgi:SAM-dependent methyltransferase